MHSRKPAISIVGMPTNLFVVGCQFCDYNIEKNMPTDIERPGQAKGKVKKT